MTETEYKDIMEIIRQELEDIEVEEDGTCHWGDVANANTHIQARLHRTINDERKAHKVMSPEEYASMPLIGWHEVCRDVDGFGGVGVRFLACRTSPLSSQDQP